MNLKRLFHRLVHSHPEGVTLATDEINSRRTNHISKQALINKLNPDGTIDNVNISDFDNIVLRLGLNLQIANYFAAPVNAIVVSVPTVAEGDMALLDDFMAIAKEVGHISEKFQQGFADGDLIQHEFDEIDKEVSDGIAALVRFRESVRMRVTK